MLRTPRIAGTCPAAGVGLILPLDDPKAVSLYIETAAVALKVTAHHGVLGLVRAKRIGPITPMTAPQESPDQAERSECFHAVEDRRESRNSQGVS